MGKGRSKLESLPLVILCRERKDFIKAAKYCRYDFVSAFVVYIQSLLDVGNALKQYVEKELKIYPQVSLFDYEPSEEDSHLMFSFSKVESDTESLTDGVHSDMEVPRGPHDNFEVPGKPKPSTAENQYQFAPNTDKSYMHNRSNEVSSGTREQARGKSTNRRQKSSNLSSSHPHHSNQAYNSIPKDLLHEDFGHHEYNQRLCSESKWARVKSTNQGQKSSNLSSSHHHHSDQVYNSIPDDLLHEDFGHHDYNQRLCSESRWEIPQSSQHMNEDFSGGPMLYPYYEDRFSHYGAEMNIPSSNAKFHKCGTVQNTPTDVPPTPPPPQVSTWDFLNLPSTNYNVYDDNYIINGYKSRSNSSDGDVREIRRREGIPDLEDETEQSSVETVFDEKTMEREKGHDLGGGTFSAAQSNSGEDTLSSDDKELKDGESTADNEIDGNSRTFVSKNLEPVTREGVNSEAEKTMVQDNETHGTSSVSTPVASYQIGLKEAVQDISDEFKNVFDCGKEFSAIIELGKLPHHSISTKLRAFASCVLGLIIPSKATHMHQPCMSFDQSSSRAKLLSNADNRKFQDLVSQKFGDISSTLEQLYTWEKKLYVEVMCEEKLRIQYDKQCKRLKNLDGRGAESDKIDDTVASITHLNSEINVAVASISAISREIHRLRDNKLLPELNKLIEGFIRLWKLMGPCHQKQFQAIKEATGHVHILDPWSKKQSNSRATLRLERTILNWSICFSNFVKTQNAFVKYLNEWLLRCILQEPEETADGIAPYSPGRIGAPPIFAVCNDWYHAIDSISEIEVCKSISNFASSLHQLYEKQEEERVQKDRVKNLSKDYEKRLKKNGVSWHCDSFFTSRERLVEQRARHEEVVRQVNDAASSYLRVGLSPIFEALGSFCSENLKIYEKLRSPNAGPHE